MNANFSIMKRLSVLVTYTSLEYAQKKAYNNIISTGFFFFFNYILVNQEATISAHFSKSLIGTL